MAMIELGQVEKSFGTNHVIKGFTAAIQKGEVVCIIGPSGSGKSTILRCINGLESHDSGTIAIEGLRVDRRDASIRQIRTQVAMVFQRFNLFPHRTALENVIEGPIFVRKEPRAEATRRGRDLLARVGLADKEAAYPGALSGGQQQRVAIARAIVNQPKLVFADEPTGNLDTKTSIDVMALFQQLWHAGLTIVFVTHEPDIARYASRIVTVRDGRIVSDIAQEPLAAAAAA